MQSSQREELEEGWIETFEAFSMKREGRNREGGQEKRRQW
jgi:hypothetical protein